MVHSSAASVAVRCGCSAQMGDLGATTRQGHLTSLTTYVSRTLWFMRATSRVCRTAGCGRGCRLKGFSRMRSITRFLEAAVRGVPLPLPQRAQRDAFASAEALEPRRLFAAIEAGVLVARGTGGNDTFS